MSDTDIKPVEAYDPETTPSPMAEFPGIQHTPTPGVPIAPHPHGETFTNQDGTTRHVPVPTAEDGSLTGVSVGIKDTKVKPWLDVQGHGHEAKQAAESYGTEEQS